MEHRYFNINKICKVLSAMDQDRVGEQALLKEIAHAGYAVIDNMQFDEFVKTVNMVFPYILREQI